MKLIIGNKNYSSWSMRPWVLLRAFDIPFEEVSLRFDSVDPGSQFKQSLQRLGVIAKVPVLIDNAVTLGGKPLTIWDSVAIVERIAECFPKHAIWPADSAERAVARSMVAEMHSGFGHLRRLCSMNIEADLVGIGQDLYKKNSGLQDELTRLDTLWSERLNHSGGPMMFGPFSAVDAFFAPVVLRIKTYGLPVSPVSQDYVKRVLALPSVQAWCNEALAENDFLDFQELYRSGKG